MRGLLNGAGEENRTLVSTLARSRSTIEPRPQKVVLNYLYSIAHLHNTDKRYFFFLAAFAFVAGWAGTVFWVAGVFNNCGAIFFK